VARVSGLFLGVLETGDRSSVTAEVRVHRHDHAWRSMEIIVTNLLHDPSVASIVINARDITERAQVKEIADSLHASIRTMSGQMSEILSELQMQNQDRARIIADAMRMGPEKISRTADSGADD
jgi:hypothetical protein